jgi:prepilin-type processing-associated H-X9-DG protein
MQNKHTRLRLYKKLLSITWALILVCTMLTVPTPAFADEPIDSSKSAAQNGFYGLDNQNGSSTFDVNEIIDASKASNANNANKANKASEISFSEDDLENAGASYDEQTGILEFDSEVDGVISLPYTYAPDDQDNPNDSDGAEQLKSLSLVGTLANYPSVVAAAESRLGLPYVYGAAGPNSFDCSGLTYWCYLQADRGNIGRADYDQRAKALISWPYAGPNSAAPGDVLWWDGHVAIYVGGGRYIHAPEPGKTVCYSSWNIENSTVLRFSGAGNTGVGPSETPTNVASTLSYTAHIQDVGDQQGWVIAGKNAGTTGASKRLEGIRVITGNQASGIGVSYTSHIQDKGWEADINNSATWKSNGQESGSRGSSKRLEAIKIVLTGANAGNYDIYYQVHAQNYGWLAWAKNGQAAGTAGFGYRLEAIRIVLVAKGSDPNKASGLQAISGTVHPDPYINANALPNLGFSAVAHIENLADQTFTNQSEFIGTTGRSLRVEALNINKLTNIPPNMSGSIEYRTHIQNLGDQGWTKMGSTSGTRGEAKRLEAVNIRLTGQLANSYDVYYRTHVQNIGWTGWSKNGTDSADKSTWSGSAGYSYRMEAIQIAIVDKNIDVPPGAIGRSFYKK